MGSGELQFVAHYTVFAQTAAAAMDSSIAEAMERSSPNPMASEITA